MHKMRNYMKLLVQTWAHQVKVEVSTELKSTGPSSWVSESTLEYQKQFSNQFTRPSREILNRNKLITTQSGWPLCRPSLTLTASLQKRIAHHSKCSYTVPNTCIVHCLLYCVLIPVPGDTSSMISAIYGSVLGVLWVLPACSRAIIVMLNPALIGGCGLNLYEPNCHKKNVWSSPGYTLHFDTSNGMQ